MGNEQLTRGVWEYFTLNRAEAKRIRDDAAREKQEGISGQWQQEYSSREILEDARRNEDMVCSSEILRRSYLAIRDSRCEEIQEECIEKGKSSVRALETTSDAPREGGKRRSWTIGHRTGNLEKKSTDFLRRIIAPVGGSGGVTLLYICTHCNSFLLDVCIWWQALQLVVCNLWRDMNGEHPTGFWLCRLAQTKMKRRFSGRTRSRRDFVRT